MANRTVGRPASNSDFMQKRDVPVQHDKARLNDQRKVRPHAAGDPAMGGRPSGGAQKEPKSPSDKLAGNYIQARDVPMKTMTEAELAEWNPFARFFKAKRNFVQGDAIGFNATAQGIDLYLVRDGTQVAHKREPSYESLTQQMHDLKGKYQSLKDDRRELSVNANRAARRMANDYARELGIHPVKIGQIGDEIPFMPGTGPSPPQARQNTPGQAGGQPAGGQAAPGGTPSPNSGGGASNYNTTTRGRSGMAPPSNMASGGRFSQPLGGGGAMNSPSSPQPTVSANPMNPGAQATPSNAPASSASSSNIPDMTVGEPQKQMMYKNAPEYFPPGSLDNLSPYQLNAQWQAFVSHKPTKGMQKNYQRSQQRQGPQMAAESYSDPRKTEERILAAIKVAERDHAYAPNRVEKDARYKHLLELHKRLKAIKQRTTESYPDTSFERDEPSHESRIRGSFSHSESPHDPSMPDLNREFAQFRDLNIEKVTEMAEREIDEMLGRTMKRMGIQEWNFDKKDADEDEENGDEQKSEKKDEKPQQVESRISRARSRWF